MNRCRMHLILVCLVFLAAVPAYCQRGTFGVDIGETTDKFGSVPSDSGLEADIDGQITVLKPSKKHEGGPSIVAGGEVRLPTDTSNHAREFAVYGGFEFKFHNNLTIGVDGQVRKIYLPPSTVDNQVFVRDKMETVEIPLLVRYAFGTSRRAYVQVQGAPEFSPRWRSAGSLVDLPNPNFDHGYSLRGTAGYDFGRWYAKATYETRYFKFIENAGNPSNLYNWKSNLISGGVGVVF